MSIRTASHAGSWYESSKSKLDTQLTNWLSVVPPASPLNNNHGAKVRGIISPHAGYSYSGPTAAWGFASLQTEGIKRVFVLGPSHHVYLRKCALSLFDAVATPLGDLPIDTELVAELMMSSLFEPMEPQADINEHSLEMQYPYLRKIFAGEDIKVVPIIVGSPSHSTALQYGAFLAPYLASPDTAFVISSDFCHWGSRFDYTLFSTPRTPTIQIGTSVSSAKKETTRYLDQDQLVHDSIQKLQVTHLRGSKTQVLDTSIKETGHGLLHSIVELDCEGMECIEFGSKVHNISEGKIGPKDSTRASEDFAQHLKETGNTICGRHPISIFLGCLVALQKNEKWKDLAIEWRRYDQSSKCESVRDSSVSYATGVLWIKE